jgi:hypothetical protein
MQGARHFLDGPAPLRGRPSPHPGSAAACSRQALTDHSCTAPVQRSPRHLLQLPAENFGSYGSIREEGKSGYFRFLK